MPAETLPTFQPEPHFSNLSQTPATPLKVLHASPALSSTLNLYHLSLANSPKALNQRPAERNHEYLLFSKLFIVCMCMQIYVP